MSLFIQYPSCCGVREIANLFSHRTPEDAMKEFCTNFVIRRWDGKQEKNTRFRYVMFTDVKNRTYGEAFATYIMDNHLGTIIHTGYHHNPNSRNMLKLWIWTLDRRALTRWEKKHEKQDACITSCITRLVA